jgi:hypothetical protein
MTKSNLNISKRNFLIATSGFGILSSFKMFSQSAVAATFSIQENDVYIPADSISSLNISFSNFNINTANIDLSKPVEITVSAGKKGNSLTQIHSTKLITLDSESEEISNQLMNYNLLDSETIPTDFSTLYNAGDSFDIIIEVEINHDDVNAQIIQEVFTANITPIVNGAAYNWDINENSGPIIESKTSVESNSLPEGISWNSDSGLSYLEFNGHQNSGVDTNILPNTGDENRAFFMWVYLNNSEGTFLEYGSSESNTQWRWRLISGDSRVENEHTGAEAELNIPTGKWIPIGITLNGNSLSDITFYVDGNTSTTNINSNINTGADNNLTFGFSPVNNTQNPLNGRIGSCIAWDTNVNTNIFDNIKDNTKYLYR